MIIHNPRQTAGRYLTDFEYVLNIRIYAMRLTLGDV